MGNSPFQVMSLCEINVSSTERWVFGRFLPLNKGLQFKFGIYSNAQAKSVDQIQQLHKEKDAVQHRAEQSDSQVQSMGIKIEHLEKEAQIAQQNLAHSATERDSAMKEASELRGQIAALKEQNAQLVRALAQPSQTSEKGKDKK